MASSGKDFRLTAVLAVRDTASAVLQKFSKQWQGVRDVVQSADFSGLQKQTRLFNRSLKNVADQATTLGAQIGAPFAALAATVGFSLQKAVTGFVQAGGDIDDTSQRLGVSSKLLQEWGYAAKMAGAAPTDLTSGLQTLSKHMAEIASGKDKTSDTAQLFKALGISVKDASGQIRPAEAVFRDLAKAIQINEDPTLRMKIAMAAFGNSGTVLVPMLKDGTAGLDAMAAKAQELGLVMSNDAIASAAKLGDQIDDLKGSFTAIGNTIGAALAPVVSQLAERFKNLAVSNRSAFSEKVTSVANQFAEAIGKIDFEKIVSGLLSIADLALKAFNAVGGFNTVLTVMGAIMAGKTVMAAVSLGTSLATLITSFGSMASVALKVGLTMASAFGPAGLVLTGIGLAAGFVITNWDKVWPAIQEGASAAFDFVTGVWDGIAPKFGAVFSALKKTATAFFTVDMQGLFSGLDDLIKSAFGLLPDSWAAACVNWYASVKQSLQEVWKQITDFFSPVQWSKLIPDWMKKFWDPSAGQGASGGGSAPSPQQIAAAAAAPAPSMTGYMAVDVTASGGARANITDLQGGGGLKVTGKTGQSDRSYDYSTFAGTD